MQAVTVGAAVPAAAAFAVSVGTASVAADAAALHTATRTASAEPPNGTVATQGEATLRGLFHYQYFPVFLLLSQLLSLLLLLRREIWASDTAALRRPMKMPFPVLPPAAFAVPGLAASVGISAAAPAFAALAAFAAPAVASQPEAESLGGSIRAALEGRRRCCCSAYSHCFRLSWC